MLIGISFPSHSQVLELLFEGDYKGVVESELVGSSNCSSCTWRIAVDLTSGYGDSGPWLSSIDPPAVKCQTAFTWYLRMSYPQLKRLRLNFPYLSSAYQRPKFNDSQEDSRQQGKCPTVFQQCSSRHPLICWMKGLRVELFPGPWHLPMNLTHGTNYSGNLIGTLTD